MFYYTGSPNWVFQAFSFVGIVLSLIPLPWHLQAYNVGTCLFMLWTSLACLILFVNAMIWDGNVLDSAPVWCDFATHALNGFNLAIPATSLCINRRLYQIASVRTVTKTKAQQRREIIIDFCIGLVLPFLQIPLQYIVQGHRYNIFEDIGCLGETYETPISVVVYHMPPIIVGSISACYCALSIRSFYKSRKQFKELLASSNTNLNLNRYLRLMALASIDLIFNIPLSIWVLYTNVSIYGLGKWISWARTHSHFSRVVQVPGIFWRGDALTAASLETLRWATIGCALVFFCFFGFADEARKNYRYALFTVARTLGISTASSSTMGGSGSAWSANQMSSKPDALPSFVRKPTVRRRDSLDSFSSTDRDSMSYDGKEKPANNMSQSFGGLTLQDVGGLLPPPDYKSEIGLSPIESPSEDGASFVLPALPPAAHTTVHAHEIV